MDAVFLELLNRSIAAGWLVLAVVAFRALLPWAPKDMRCLLWDFVGLRLLLPSRLKSVISFVPSTQTIPPAILLSEAPTVQTGFAAVDRVVNPVITESFAPAVGDSVNPLYVWVHAGAIVWLCGLAALLLYAGISYLRLRRRLAESVPLRDNIRLSDRIASPFVLGLFRPRIYLPFGLDEETTAMVLAHERGHLFRLDHWFKPLGFLLLALCWFHPFSWLAYALYCRDLELACDEHVLRTLGPDTKKAYSAALLACSAPSRLFAACPLAFGESDVKTRIKSALSYKKPTLWVLLISVSVVALMTTGFLTDPVDRSAAAVGEPNTLENLEWSDFLAELIRVESEEGGYLGIPTPVANGQSFEGPYTYLGYACRYDAPLLRLPGADAVMRDSGYVFIWDDGERLRLKELWYDEEEREALVVRWSPGVYDPDPAYGEGGLSYPEYSWSHGTLDWDFDFEDTWINFHFYNYSSDRFPFGSIRLTEGMHFASAESLLTPDQHWIMQASRLRDLELGGYEPITEADAARHADFSLLTLPELPDRFEPSGAFYAMDASGAPGIGSARFARLWFSPATEEALFASWLENPGRADEPMSMAYWRLINTGGTGWANFLAESRGKVGDTDVVLRYYAADANTDPEAVRGFMENVELAPVTAFAPTASSPSIVTLPGLAAQSAGFDAALSVPVGGSAAVLPALGLANRRPSSIGMDIYDGGYCRIELNEAGQPLVLGLMPTELPVPIEVQFSKQTYRLAVTVEPDPSGSAAPLYNEPDPAAVDALQILFNDRPLSALTASAGRSYLLDTQALPGGAVKAEWTCSDESVARVTVRADGRCVLDALRETEEPVTITAAYGEHRAAFTLAIN